MTNLTQVARFHSIERQIKRFLPFTASSMIWRFTNKRAKNCQSLVDIGCGSGESVHDLVPASWYKVGVEIDSETVRVGKKAHNLDEFIIGDVNHLPFKPKSFDLAFCCEVIEHLQKSSGKILLSQAEICAKLFVIIRAPNGRFKQEFPEHPNMEHRSEWYSSDFTPRGYLIKGNTIRFVWDQDGPAKKIPLIAPFFYLLNVLLGPLVFFVLPIAGDFLCIKEINAQLS